jgi:glycosyltransferase involved in cell wall biosynthesis
MSNRAYKARTIQAARENTKSSVSVIIPTIDGNERTRRAVRSALHQTLPPMEVIVVDDGSPQSLNAKALGDGDPRVIVVRLPSNRGAAGARQVGAEAARGQFLAFLDADDAWLPQKLEKQLAFLEVNSKAAPLVAVSCGWLTTRPASRREVTRMPIPSASLLDFLSGCWFCPGSTLLLAREAFFQVGAFDQQLPRLEDLEWGIRFALSGGQLLVAPIVAASIQPSGRARFAQVAEAARIISERYAADPRLSLPGRRRLMAYLALERAAAAKAEGAYLRAVFELAYSLVLKPRWSIPIRQWWTVQSAR